MVLETTLTILLSAAGAVGVFALGLFADSRRAQLAIKTAKQDRDDLRTMARQDRREDFEIATLTELQDVIQTMARQVGIGHHSDAMHYKATGNWITGAPALPEAAGGEASLVAGRSFLKLKPRVLSPELRQILEAFNDAHTFAIQSPAGDGTNDAGAFNESLRRMALMADCLTAAQEALGARLRELYAV